MNQSIEKNNNTTSIELFSNNLALYFTSNQEHEKKLANFFLQNLKQKKTNLILNPNDMSINFKTTKGRSIAVSFLDFIFYCTSNDVKRKIPKKIRNTFKYFKRNIIIPNFFITNKKLRSLKI